MKHKTIGNFFNDLSAGEYSPFRGLSRTKVCAALVLFILSMSAVYAQPKSQCVIEDNGQDPVLECDVSFTVVLSTSDGTVSDVWDPDASAKDLLSFRFREFAEDWCQATAANSRIREISVFTDGTTADFWYQLEIGGNPYARGGFANLGGFPFIKPSAAIFNSRGGVMVHEFAHAALKIYDEYTGPVSSSSSCGTPLTTYDTLKTVMGNTINDRFSYPADYPKRGGIRTSQWACYGESAWEVFIQSAYWNDVRPVFGVTSYPRQDYFFRIGADIPDFTRDISYSCDAPTINWIPSTITTNTASTFSNKVAVMIDHSASMGDDQRLSVAQRAAKGAIDLLYVEKKPVSVSIVGFDDIARTEVALTPLDSVENIRMIKSAIDAFTADGGTDYGAALAHVQTVFVAADGDGQKVLIIISDGETEQADLDYFKTNKILVYTVELDTEGKVVLQDAVTKARNRLNMEVDAQRLTSFLPSVLRDTSLIRNNQLTTSVSLQIGYYADVVTTTTLISTQSDSAHFILRWDEEASFGSFTLQSPDGAMIDQAYAARVSTDSIVYLEGASQAIYTIGSPISGEWQVHIRGRGHFEYETAVSSGIIAGINAGAELILQEEPSDVVAYPEPIPILVHVGGAEPITYADVMAKVTMPDDSTMSLRLLDDGNAPDEVEGDGLYSAMMADYSQDGICEIKVTVSNLEDRAMYDSTRLARHIVGSGSFGLGPYVPAEPKMAPSFQRVVYDQVDVINTKEKFMQMSGMLPMITTITSIPYDNAARFERDNQVDWYRFDAMKEGQRYYIQTSDLYPPDMVTDLRLHETPDTDKYDDPIRDAVGNCGNASSIEWEAFGSGNYFISVAHAEQGKGSYKLTVRTKNGVMCDMRQDRRGGFVGYPLLLLLLLAMTAWYRTEAGLQVCRRDHR